MPSVGGPRIVKYRVTPGTSASAGPNIAPSVPMRLRATGYAGCRPESTDAVTVVRSESRRTVDGLWQLCGEISQRFGEPECRNHFQHCGYRYS